MIFLFHRWDMFSSEHQISQDSSEESLSRFDNLWIQHVEKLLNLLQQRDDRKQKTVRNTNKKIKNYTNSVQIVLKIIS